MTPAPSPEEQLAFLSHLQRLLSEGDFTATYKYALLMSLAELAVESGHDDGATLSISHRAIGAKFIDLYWQQVAPYSAGRSGTQVATLHQNTGKQAAVIRTLEAFQCEHPLESLASVRRHAGYAKLVTRVTATVVNQPVKYLQNVGGQVLPFLYASEADHLVLLPGVAYCLRRFHPLITQLVRQHWVERIKQNRLNLPMLGETGDLESFLFDTPRKALLRIGHGLHRLSNGRCFYCEGKLAQIDVDHFIPFSLYPRDLAHNFVIAHPSCNRSKSDTLAAKRHLDRWLDFIHTHDVSLREIGSEAGQVGDLPSTLRVAAWGYGNGWRGGARAWVRSGQYETVDSGYLDRLAA